MQRPANLGGSLHRICPKTTTDEANGKGATATMTGMCAMHGGDEIAPAEKKP